MQNRSVRFRTERFDYQGELPEEYNAGNKFYGRDLAEFLANGLSSPHLATDFLDEDWGWLVLGKTDDNRFLEIAVYHMADRDEASSEPANEWGLWVRMFEKRKWLGFMSRSHEIDCPSDIAEALHDPLGGAGIAPTPWEEPEGGA